MSTSQQLVVFRAVDAKPTTTGVACPYRTIIVFRTIIVLNAPEKLDPVRVFANRTRYNSRAMCAVSYCL